MNTHVADGISPAAYALISTRDSAQDFFIVDASSFHERVASYKTGRMKAFQDGHIQ